MKQFLNKLSLHTMLHRQHFRQELAFSEVPQNKDAQQASWPLERLLTWFLFSWLGLIYAQGMLHLAAPQPSRPFPIELCVAAFPLPGICFFTSMLVTLHDLPRPATLTLFTLLLLLHGMMFWIGLGAKVRSSFFWPFFLLQAALFLAVGLIEQQTYLALSLYLALILVALAMLKRVRLTLIILCIYSVLLLSLNYCIFISMQILYKQGLIGSTPSWNVTDYTALILFVVGYLLLYVQQVYAQKRIAAYATRVEELTRLTERQRLARELHDTLSQGLIGLSLQLDAVDALLIRQRPERAQEVVRQAMKRVSDTLAETRSSLDNLREQERHISPGTLLPERIYEQIEQFTSSTGLACNVELSPLTTLPSAMAHTLLRIVAEGLTNIARHARAQQITIRLCQQEREVVIEVRDDGIGFDPKLIDHATGHYGLPGLRERTHSLGGQMRIESAPGKGTLLHFTIPLG